MLLNLITLAAALIPAGLCLPTQSLQPRAKIQARADAGSWNKGAVYEYPIHESCNATETTQLRQALRETEELAEHAKQHILRWGNSSEWYQKYFGDAPTAPVIGNYERVIFGNKDRTLFRCDDPDSNCKLHPDTYGGHWRGENATDETVICPLSYETREPLSKLCALGYNVAEWPTNTYFASDLLHRVFHMPAISDFGYIDHFTEEYHDVIEMAKTNSTYSGRDSDTLQYFALEVFAYDIAVPSQGCPGPQATAHASASASGTAAAATSEATASASETSAAVLKASSTPTESASKTLVVPPGCHTHAGSAELHCE